MLKFLLVVRDFSWMLYAGPLIAFGILLAFISIIKKDDRHAVIQQFCLFGPIFGIALGTAIFSGLGVKWIEDGHFTLVLGTSTEQIFAVGIVFAFMLWVSNIILEIWTLDPIRKADSACRKPDEKSLTKTVKHIYLQSLLATITTLLCSIGSFG